MKTFFRAFLWKKSILAGLFLMGVAAARSEVVVQDADLTSSGSRYRFALIPGKDFGPNNEALDPKNSRLSGALVSASNLRYIGETFATGASFITPILNTESNATMILGWDFSQSTSRPKSVDLTDILVIFGVEAGNTTVITLSWSTDNQTWTSFATLSGKEFTSKETKTIPLTSPDHFYLKCEFSGIPSNLDVARNQWGRVPNSAQGADHEAFSADFTMDRAPLK